MKLREIDEKLYEFSFLDGFKKVIQGANAATALKKLGKDGVKQSAYNYIRDNIPNYLDKVSDNIAQNKRRRNQQTNNQDRSNQQDPEITYSIK